MRLSSLRSAPKLPIEPALVDDCLDAKKRPIDAVFRQAWKNGLSSLTPNQRRGALAGATGHITESVVELLLAPYGYIPVHDFPGPGRHGVDLLLLTPDAGAIVAVEVKGTLCHHRWPRLSRGDLEQMSAPWIDKGDNPAMVEWDLESSDVYGAVALVNFADMVYRIAFTTNFQEFTPVTNEDQLADPNAWLGR